MWLAGTEADAPTNHLFVGERQCGLWCGHDAEPVWRSDADVEALLRSHRPARVWWRRAIRLHVWLSGLVARPFLVGPIQGLRGSAEIRQIALAKVGDSTGLLGPCDIRVDGEPASEVAVVTAAQSIALQQLEGLVKDAGFQLTSVRPWWAEAINSLLDAGAGRRSIAIYDGESLTLLAANNAEWLAADSCPVGDQFSEIEAMVRRRILGLGIASTGVIAAMRGTPLKGSAVRCWPVPLVKEPN